MKKIRMSALLAIMAALLVVTTVFADFTNGNFETGDFSGWTQEAFLNDLGLSGMPPFTGANIQRTTGAGEYLQSSIVGPFPARSQTDPYTPIQYPGAGSYSAIVNGDDINFVSNTLKQTITVGAGDVDPSDGLIHVRFIYAPVFQQPNHVANDQPWFYVYLHNDTTNATLYDNFRYVGDGDPLWTDNGNGWWYMDWISVDISGGINSGDTLTLEVIAADCALGGHAGYVYIDEISTRVAAPSITANAPASVNRGDTITYTFNYNSVNAVTNAVATVSVPTGTTFVSSSLCTEAAGVMTCNIGNIAAGGNGSFTVVVDTDGSSPDPVVLNTYSIVATGTNSSSGPAVNTALLAPPNLAPTSLALSNRFIQEERPANVIVDALSSTDPDAGDTATYSLVDTVACDGTDNGYFAVDGTNLVTSGTPRIDFQTKYYLSVCLRVTDSGALTFDQNFTIVVRSIHQFPMDVDGDGKDDYVTFRPNTGTWHLRLLPPIVGFGQLGDLPVAADFNGDGKDDIAVFRPGATGQWLVRGQNPVNFGTAGDVPLPLDFNGDKKADFAVFRPSTATWHIRGQLLTLAFGQTGDIPVPADYNGDGKADIAVFRPSNGTWYIQNQPAIAFGVDGDIPVPFDYNKDGKAEIAVYRPSTGTWHIRNMAVITFGGMYDQPFPMHLQSATSVNYVVIHTGAVAMEWQAQGLPTINFGANDDVHQ